MAPRGMHICKKNLQSYYLLPSPPHSPPPFFSLPDPGPCSTRRPPCPGSEPPHPPSLLPRQRRRLGATAPSTLCPISGPLRRGREGRAEHAAAPRQRPCLPPYLLRLGLAPAAASYCSGRWPAPPRELRWPWPHPAVQGLAAASAGLVAAADEHGTAVRVRGCASLGPRRRAWIYGGTQRRARVHGGARSLRPRGLRTAAMRGAWGRGGGCASTAAHDSADPRRREQLGVARPGASPRRREELQAMAARGARDRGGFGQQQREELGVAAAGRVCCSARRRALVRGGVRILGLRRARVGGGGRRSAAARGSRGRNSGVPRAACRGAGPARHRSSPAAWICSEPRRGRRERERGRGGGEAGPSPRRARARARVRGVE